MAFVNERGFMVNEVDRKKYNDLYVQANKGKGDLGSADWTIDREREMLLVCLYTERQDMYEGNFHRSNWVFYWHGEWVHFLQQDHSEKISENHWRKTREVKEITMPDIVKKDAVTFYSDLKEAFKVYRRIGAGEGGREYLFDLTLDISEVL